MTWHGKTELRKAGQGFARRSTAVFTEHLEQAGQFIGIGRFRPRNNGYYGRFGVKNMQWDV